MRTVRNFSPLEFAAYVAYLEKKRVLHNFPADKLDYFYMLCGESFVCGTARNPVLVVDRELASQLAN